MSALKLLNLASSESSEKEAVTVATRARAMWIFMVNEILSLMGKERSL
jgi:hypothetical protein